MPKIIAETATETISFDATEGRKLVLELEDNGVDMLHRCGGNARCTTCAIELLGGEAGAMTEAEVAILTTKDLIGGNIRLSCQIRCQNDLSVRVLRQASTSGLEPGTRPEE